MRKLLIFLLLALPAFSQTVNTNFYPAQTGLSLGRNGQRWNLYASNLDITGTITVNGAAGHFALLPVLGSGQYAVSTDLTTTNQGECLVWLAGNMVGQLPCASSGTLATVYAVTPTTGSQGTLGLIYPPTGLKSFSIFNGTNWVNASPYDSDARIWGCDNTGATSATVCLQAMFDAVSTSTGQSVKIPSGTYLIGAGTELHLRREMTIAGSGGGADTPATVINLGSGANIVVDKSTVSSDGGRGDWSVLRDVKLLGTFITCTATATSGSLTACSGDPSAILNLAANDYVVGMERASSPFLWRLWFPQGTQVASTTSTTITLAGAAVSAYSGTVTIMKSGRVVGAGTTSNGSTSITGVSGACTNWQPGDPIQGLGISYPNFITGCNTGASTLTLFSAAGAAAGAGNLTKGPLANIAVHGGSLVLEDVSIDYCAGFCYDNNGSASYTPATVADGQYINRLRVTRSGDALVHFQGADANIATVIGVQGTYGANGCIYDQSFLGNTFIGGQCSSSDGYPYQTSNANARSVFISSYSEGGQKNPKYTALTLVLNGIGQSYGAGGGSNGNFITDDGRMSPSFYVKNLQGGASTASCANGSPSLTNVTSIAQWHVGDTINADCLPSTTLVSATDGVSVLTANKNANSSGDLIPITQTVTKLLLGQPNLNSSFGFAYSTNNSSDFNWLLEYDDPAYRAAGTYEPGFFSWRYRNSGKAMSFPTDQSLNSDDQVVNPGTTAPIKFANGIRIGTTTNAPAIKASNSASAPTSGEWQNGSLAISTTNGLWQQRNAGKSVAGTADITVGSTTLANQNAAFLAGCTVNDRIAGTGIQTGTILVDQNTLSKAATATTATLATTCKRIAKAHVVTTCDTNTSTSLTNCSSISGWAQYDTIQGTGIPAGTFITVAPSGTTITLSQAATATDTGVTVSDATFAKYSDNILYNSTGTAQTATHTVRGRCTLGTDCGVTLTGDAVYTSSSSYDCTAIDRTAAAAVKFVPSSGSAFALTGTGTDLLSYICVGN